MFPKLSPPFSSLNDIDFQCLPKERRKHLHCFGTNETIIENSRYNFLGLIRFLMFFWTSKFNTLTMTSNQGIYLKPDALSLSLSLCISLDMCGKFSSRHLFNFLFLALLLMFKKKIIRNEILDENNR